jgi:molecular chaperone DnaK
VGAGDLDAIVLVGGSTLMPWVARRIYEVTGVEPFRGISPFTSVAQGAAIHAAILDAKHRSNSELAERVRRLLAGVRQEDVNSHGLGVAARNPKTGKIVNHVMIPRNSRLPVEVTQTFVTTHDRQERVNIQVIEGDAPDPAACSLLGNCRVTGLPEGLPKGSPIEVTYSFDTAGRIFVRARDKSGGQEATINIERRSGLSDQQVDAYAALAADYVVE